MKPVKEVIKEAEQKEQPPDSCLEQSDYCPEPFRNKIEFTQWIKSLTDPRNYGKTNKPYGRKKILRKELK